MGIEIDSIERIELKRHLILENGCLAVARISVVLAML
jgi:hypothetical protein